MILELIMVTFEIAVVLNVGVVGCILICGAILISCVSNLRNRRD